jgi:hypothetical protein
MAKIPAIIATRPCSWTGSLYDCHATGLFAAQTIISAIAHQKITKIPHVTSFLTIDKILEQHEFLARGLLFVTTVDEDGCSL